jgi:mRNA-degrading endonuclease RelE of RelBE toxin-antitoxin system
LAAVTVRRRPHAIEYTPEATSHLKSLAAHEAAKVLDAVVRQLTYEPRVPTRNRKLLRANLIAPWELRVGDIRVYFDVADEPEALVIIRAVGVKLRNRVIIGGEEVELR